MDHAEEILIKHIQRLHYDSLLESIQENKLNNLKVRLGVYLDPRELLIRCHGRLENSEIGDETKNHLLLPKAGRFTQLIIDQVHRGSHHTGVAQTLAQVRHRYWISSGRSAVRKVLRRCTVCKRWEGGSYRIPTVPPLPRKRVKESILFSHSEIDYFGQLYVKAKPGTQNLWVCLFTCLVTRAVHLVLMLDMSTETFLLGLRRFEARRGSPCEIISDNASQFKLELDTIDTL